MLRQRLHRYSVAMKGNDLLVAKDAANHYWDFIDACDNKLSGYRGVEEKKSEDKEGSAEKGTSEKKGTPKKLPVQFFREIDGGLSDKYYFVHWFFITLGPDNICIDADRPSFDEDDVKRSIVDSFSKLFDGYPSDNTDGGEDEEWRMKGLFIKPRTESEIKTYKVSGSLYTDGRYTKSPPRVFLNWKQESGDSFFAWPIQQLRESCDVICKDTVCTGKELSDVILKGCFRWDYEHNTVMGLQDIEAPRKPKIRKWAHFEKCFAYYSRGLKIEGWKDEYPNKFSEEILLKNGFSYQLPPDLLDRIYLAFLVFQSEMMAAYLLENTRAALSDYLSADAVNEIFERWRKVLPKIEELPEIEL